MKVCVLLNGSGHQDGTEITEAVLSMLALSQGRIAYQCVSLNESQKKVIDHISSESQSEQRSMLAESARIARGDILEMEAMNPEDFDGLVIPGGMGACLNLSDFAEQGNAMQVHPVVTKWINSFHQRSKPIMAVCIAPILVAKVLGDRQVKVTVGDSQEVSSLINGFGALHHRCDKGNCLVDENNRVVSTPAYMYEDSEISQVYDGIKAAVVEFKRMLF